jgi:hypothetical protein
MSPHPATQSSTPYWGNIPQSQFAAFGDLGHYNTSTTHTYGNEYVPVTQPMTQPMGQSMSQWSSVHSYELPEDGGGHGSNISEMTQGYNDEPQTNTPRMSMSQYMPTTSGAVTQHQPAFVHANQNRVKRSSGKKHKK